jgi:hypothetical protein
VYCLDGPRSIPDRGKRLFLLFSSYSGFFSRGSSGRGMTFSIQFQVVPWLGMGGAISLLPLYAFMAETETTLRVRIATVSLSPGYSPLLQYHIVKESKGDVT